MNEKQIREAERRNIIHYLKRKRQELESMHGMKEGAFGYGTLNGMAIAILEIELMPEVDQ